MFLRRLAVPFLMLASLVVGTLVNPAQSIAAEKKLVLQISDASPEKQTLVLNVANNLQKTYGPGNIKIEIVAFGPGLKMLFKDNSNSERVSSLVAGDVRFSACGNTLEKTTKFLGRKPELHKDAVIVQAGVERIIELTEQGYLLVRP